MIKKNTKFLWLAAGILLLLFAVLIVLVAVLASTVVEWVKWFAAFIGAGLAFAALTDTCAMGMLLAKLPYNRGPRVTLGRVVATLAVERR